MQLSYLSRLGCEAGEKSDHPGFHSVPEINILALEMASPENRHCANRIGALSFPIRPSKPSTWPRPARNYILPIIPWLVLQFPCSMGRGRRLMAHGLCYSFVITAFSNSVFLSRAAAATAAEIRTSSRLTASTSRPTGNCRWRHEVTGCGDSRTVIRRRATVPRKIGGSVPDVERFISPPLPRSSQQNEDLGAKLPQQFR